MKTPFLCRIGMHNYNSSYSSSRRGESYDHCWNCKTRYYRDDSGPMMTRPAGCFIALVFIAFLFAYLSH